MLDNILKWSIAQRWLVVIGAIVVTFLGIYNLTQMPLDVFPDFAPPRLKFKPKRRGWPPKR